MNATTGTSARPLLPHWWSVVRDDLAARRAQRADYRSLQRELASYRSQADVNDLLALVSDQEGAEVDMIRSILTGNLQQPATHRLAS